MTAFRDGRCSTLLFSSLKYSWPSFFTSYMCLRQQNSTWNVSCYGSWLVLMITSSAEDCRCGLFEYSYSIYTFIMLKCEWNNIKIWAWPICDYPSVTSQGLLHNTCLLVRPGLFHLIKLHFFMFKMVTMEIHPSRLVWLQSGTVFSHCQNETAVMSDLW